MPSVIIVSNRLPVSVKKIKGELEFSHAAGGVSNALSTYAAEGSNKWIGWPGIPSDDLTEADHRTITKKLAEYNCYPVFLTKKQLDGFYNGFCNSILWQLFHNLPVNFEHQESYWRTYLEVNQIFTNAILSHSNNRNNIWVHDYQLLLVPALLRLERPHDNIGLFLHIPFPNPKQTARLPHAKQILSGMLGADVVGFHTSRYTNDFLDSVNDQNVGLVSEKNVLIGTRVIQVTEFPIGIDYAKSIKLSNSVEVEREARAHRRKYGRKKIILTVDRLDMTKGLVQRLRAYETFLEEHPKYHSKVVMVMLANPTRSEVSDYKLLRKQVESLVTKINEKYGVAGWLPVDYKYETLPYESVVALYKIADVAFIAPLIDGMNMVAKEYVASKKNRDGVLILSETAGAAEELTNAIIVNPRRRLSMVAALDKALNMPQLELRKRLNLMQKQISKNSVQKWANNFVNTLQRSAKSNFYPTRMLSGGVRKVLLDNYNHAQRRQIFLDYDGTVTSFRGDPSDAKPTAQLLNILRKLCDQVGNQVVVVSGRGRDTLDGWLGVLPVTLVAEHGAFVKKPGGKWTRKHHAALGWKKSIRKMIEIYAERTPGSFVEEKDSALVWHFRKSPPYQAQKNMVILKQLLAKSLRGTDLKVYSGHKILEVKPKSANKGVVVSELVLPKVDFILSIGDDYTDEDMFTSLPGFAFTVKVGPGRTDARYRLKSVDEVLTLLKKLV